MIGLGEEFNGLRIYDINATELTKRRILCPFWTDLLTGDTEGNIYYQTYERLVLNENVNICMNFIKRGNLIKIRCLLRSENLRVATAIVIFLERNKEIAKEDD